ncbi:hypothetical protein [Picosynechococcus sp. NKBG042902]|uniref:hypothetical protein n=1 Tax=Picosynechococcus sp. NKBG042902 TaxID=490193 RepID=UPI0004AA5795|nr:hypothetical protein [Picosynechococcus sp. NKBG042902]
MKSNFSAEPSTYDLLRAATKGSLKSSSRFAGRRLSVNLDVFSCSLVEELAERSDISQSQVVLMMIELAWQTYAEKLESDDPQLLDEFAEALHNRQLNLLGLSEPLEA